MATRAPRTAAASAEAQSNKATYVVLSKLHHGEDGPAKDYLAGDEIELTEDQAAPLLGHTVQPKA